MTPHSHACRIILRMSNFARVWSEPDPKRRRGILQCYSASSQKTGGSGKRGPRPAARPKLGQAEKHFSAKRLAKEYLQHLAAPLTKAHDDIQNTQLKEAVRATLQLDHVGFPSARASNTL